MWVVKNLWIDIARTRISPELVEFFGRFFSDSVSSEADFFVSISPDGGEGGVADFQKFGSKRIFSTVKMRRYPTTEYLKAYDRSNW
jgi:hypothetical protein